MATYTMDNTVEVVVDAVADDVCRHCLNARNDGTPAPALCTECGRCYGLNKCQCAPTCVVRDVVNYAGAEDSARVDPPHIITSTPLGDSEGSDPFAVNTTLSVTLHKDINPTTLTTGSVYLVDVDGEPIGPAASSNPTVVGGVITLHLSASLAYSTVYAIRVTQEVLDIDGLPPASEITTPAFTTRSSDVVAPTVVSVSPANGATGVAAQPDIVVTFSEAMNPGILQFEGVSAGVIFITAEDGGTEPTTAALVMSVGNTVATVTYVEYFQAGKRYKVHVATDAHDANGNALAAEYVQAAGFTVAP